MNYDALPFSGKTYRGQHIDHLYTLSKIYNVDGVKNPKEGARVLEIGCSTGEHIIPQAMEFSKSTFVGIDPSRVAIERATSAVQNLNLTNIEFKECGVEQLQEEGGSFDFILCHGLYSWSPHTVQEEILKGVRKYLAPAGIAVISYNCQPGWHIRSLIRDWIRHNYTAAELVPENVNTIAQELKGVFDLIPYQFEKPYTLVLHHELYRILKEPLSYLYHEYCGDGVSGEWYQRFCKKLATCQLSPVTDSRQSRDFFHGKIKIPAGDHQESAKTLFEKLSLSDDEIAKSVHLDFIYGNSFRETLVTHAVERESRFQREQLGSLKLYASLSPAPFGVEVAEEIDENIDTLVIQANVREELQSDAKKVLTALLHEQPHFLKLEKIDLPESQKYLVIESLFRNDLITLSLNPPRFDLGVRKPQVNAWAKFQIEQKNPFITSKTHNSIAIGDFERHLLPLLDGTRGSEELISLFEEYTKGGRGTLKEEGVEITDADKIREHLRSLISKGIDSAWRLGLLE